MRIGVDGRNLVNRNNGIGRYLVESCIALSRAGNDIVIYTPMEVDKGVLEEVAEFRYSRVPNNSICRLLWGEVLLPLMVNSDKPDVFWGPAHRLPRFIYNGIPTIVTIHDLIWKYYPDTMKGLRHISDGILMKSASLRADAIICVSRSTECALKSEWAWVEGKTHTIYPGVFRTKLDDELPLSLGEYILFVGTVEPRKNIERLLEAYAGLPALLRGKHKLIIAGASGWGDVKIHEHIERLFLADDVVLLGYVDDDRLSRLYKNAYLLAFPSLYEGFGFPIVEANINGVPVLTSNASSMPEVAGKAGYFIDPHDIGDIRGGLHSMLTDASVYDERKKNARANALKFSWERAGSELDLLFRKLVKAVKMR